MPFVGRLASGPSWPQRIMRLAMKQILITSLLVVATCGRSELPPNYMRFSRQLGMRPGGSLGAWAAEKLH